MYRGADAAYPLVRGDTVLVLEDRDAGGHLVAIDRATGDRRWRTSFAVAGCSLSVDSDHVYTWCVTGTPGTEELVALAGETGDVLWRHRPAELRLPSATAPLVAIADGVCWTAGDSITAVDAETGRLSWTRRLGLGTPLSVPVCASEYVYVTSNEGLAALRAQDGEMRWQVRLEPLQGRHRAPLLQYDGEKIVVAQRRLTGTGALRCHDPDTGRLRWASKADFPIHSVTLARHVYVRSESVHAYAADTGRPLWSADIGGCSPVVLARGRLYAVEGREHPLILALDPDTGERTWERLLASSCSGLVVVGGRGYLSAHDGSLYALAI